MTTPGDFPPHEARGGLGNIMDPGGGGNTLKPSPLPNAITGGGPGLSTAAANYPGGPTVAGVEDPQAIALLVAKLAGEWFGGSSLAPSPSVSSGWTSAGLSPPASPGISPALIASTPMGMAGSSAGLPQDASATALPQQAFAPSLVPAPGSPPDASPNAAHAPAYSGSNPSSYPASSHGLSSSSPHSSSYPSSTHGRSSSSPHARSSSSPHVSSNPSSSHGRSSSSPHSSSTHHPQSSSTYPPTSQSSAAPPASGHGTDARGKSGVSSASVPASSRSGGESRSRGASSPSSASAPSSSGRQVSTNPSNPFDVAPDLSSLDGGMPFVDLRLPIFGSSDLDAPPFDLSALDGSRFDAARLPGFDAPSASAFDAPLELDTPYEVRSTDDAVIRELGGVGFDPYRVRRDFPILEERIHGKRLVWLDNAATTQKPLAVIERLSEFYKHENSNIHRAAHTLAARATDAYEKARDTTREFLNASSTNEIIFVRGATEGINLIAQSWGRKNVGAGDEIVITHLEHHANIVPWQQLCSETGARLRVAPVDDRGDVILEEYEKLLSTKTKLVALPQVSNALGTITPAREMVEMAHRYGARVLVDGAQAVSHMKVDVQLLDCDFYVFSGHKVFAPTGIGAVFGKRELLDSMPPWQGGGNMIEDVTFERTTYQAAPFRFEAGTGNIADAAGLGAALDYVMQIGLDTIDRYEHELLVYATHHLARVPGLRMIGTSPNKAGVLSFTLEGQRTEDVGAALDQEGIAVRSGHHCAQPILRRFGVEATVRASLAFYNVCEDVDALVDALLRMQAGHARR